MRVLPEAWPTVRTLVVVCGDARQSVTLGVRGGWVVWVPVAAKSPAGLRGCGWGVGEGLGGVFKRVICSAPR